MRALGVVLAVAAFFVPATASAFCGFYVSGADASLYNNATVVALMRDDTRTVLSMQNSYEGPPSDFAMVVPVPVVLQEDNVKTLTDEIFARLDQLAAPRLVEYWEQDPCYQPQIMRERRMMAPSAAGAAPEAEQSGADLGVTVEAEFTVGEYDIQILSASDSSGLDTWLRQEDYNIPDGAEPVLRPYVEAGTKFFVAKVDVEKVKFQDGKAVLSPLRFHYDTDEFSLPVRLGLLNSAGQQDLIVHILARGQRYEVANYDNATIPTNIKVENDVREHFGGFYEKLFSRTLERNPGAVVTEYSWDASSCDPCPTPALDPGELKTLGADVLDNPQPYGFVLTRLHYRYGKDELGEDLVFKEAPPIVGGRGTPDQWGRMQTGAQPSGRNMFQGRYAILHEWEGDIDCENPQRGRWGGPPGQGRPRPGPVPMPEPRAAPSVMRQGGSPAELARSAPALGMLVAEDVPELDLKAGTEDDAPVPGDKATGAGSTGGGSGTGAPPETGKGEGGGCAGCAAGGGSAAGTSLLALLALLGLAALRRRR